MIAAVTAGKFVDGTPLYRMADVLARANIAVGRGTLANWIIRPSELHYHRLYEALRTTLLSQPLIHGDETTVQVLKEPGKTAQSQSYMWVYRSAEECARPVVLFDYQPGHGQEYPQAFLADYHGMLMSDGYAAWRTLDGPTHFGCLAHARRMFVDAMKGQKKPGGRAPVDNNVIERDIRPFCTGRKSWLFSDSVAGAKASAMVYSLMLTCRACGVEPYAYLLHVLTELPQRAPERRHHRSAAVPLCRADQGQGFDIMT